MNVFHHQGDISSDTSEDGEASESAGRGHSPPQDPLPLKSALSQQDDETGNDTSKSGAPSSASFSTVNLQGGGGIDVGASIHSHQGMFLASLLEAYLHNLSLSGSKSEEKAKALFKNVSETLKRVGLLDPDAIADYNGDTRRQYIAALNNMVANMQNTPDGLRSNNENPLIRPAGSPQGILTSDHYLGRRSKPDSHYQSHFKELKLLGKGGFGKVFGCYNIWDQRPYAVKKIQLSRKFAAPAAQGNHEDMHELLREVIAMSRLEHVNIVRYHGTWIEQPRYFPVARDSAVNPDSDRAITGPGQPQLLLDIRPFNLSPVYEPSFSDRHRLEDSGMSDGIYFTEDTPSQPVEEDANKPNVDDDSGSSFNVLFEDDSHSPSATGDRKISEKNKSHFSEYDFTETDSEERSLGYTGDSVFSDGRGDGWSKAPALPRSVDDPTKPILYIQMSLYPMTLAEYIGIPDSSRSPSPIRHCFHLGPTLRLTLVILDGIQYIHANGFIHRDIKPGNIFLSQPEEVFRHGYSDVSCGTCHRDGKPLTRFLNPRIGDFGLVAQLASEGLVVEEEPGAAARAHEHVGTVPYCPPVWDGDDGDGHAGESRNFARRPDDEKTDIYALGVTLLEMLWGFTTKMERDDVLKKDLQRKIPSLGLREKLEAEGFDAAVVDDVLALVMAMVDPNPAQRWFGGQVRSALTGLLGRI